MTRNIIRTSQYQEKCKRKAKRKNIPNKQETNRTTDEYGYTTGTQEYKTRQRKMKRHKRKKLNKIREQKEYMNSNYHIYIYIERES